MNQYLLMTEDEVLAFGEVREEELEEGNPPVIVTIPSTWLMLTN